jgi:hypothetical protein
MRPNFRDFPGTQFPAQFESSNHRAAGGLLSRNLDGHFVRNTVTGFSQM